jgi:hypothetical protein
LLIELKPKIVKRWTNILFLNTSLKLLAQDLVRKAVVLSNQFFLAPLSLQKKVAAF